MDGEIMRYIHELWIWLASHIINRWKVSDCLHFLPDCYTTHTRPQRLPSVNYEYRYSAMFYSLLVFLLSTIKCPLPCQSRALRKHDLMRTIYIKVSKISKSQRQCRGISITDASLHAKCVKTGHKTLHRIHEIWMNFTSVCFNFNWVHGFQDMRYHRLSRIKRKQILNQCNWLIISLWYRKYLKCFENHLRHAYARGAGIFSPSWSLHSMLAFWMCDHKG